MKAFAAVLVVLLLLSGASVAQTGPGQVPAPAPVTAPASAAQTVAVASTPEAASAASAEAAAAPPAASMAPARFGPGAKLFVEPIDGYGELLAVAIAKKKVPVVLVHDRAEADFVLSGDAQLKKPGWLKGEVLYPHAKANLAITNAHTGEVVFAYKLDEKQESMSAGQLYESSAYTCAKHLKKAMQKK
jgi:hypothetical protein